MGSPYERHWWPATSPEPDTAVRAVALAGQDPSFLRAERREDGWHTDGLGAAHPGASQPRGWGELGQCWAGVEHPVVNVSDWLAQQAGSGTTDGSPQHQVRRGIHAT